MIDFNFQEWKNTDTDLVAAEEQSSHSDLEKYLDRQKKKMDALKKPFNKEHWIDLYNRQQEEKERVAEIKKKPEPVKEPELEEEGLLY